MKALLFKIGIFGASVTLLLIFVWLWYAYALATPTLKDVNVQSCDQLPSISELDELFSTNRAQLSILLDDLSLCGDNISVCKEYSKCKKEEYEKRRISSGNTAIEWKIVPECGDQNKAALLISHSSGCESQAVSEFMRLYPAFDRVPADWYNF